MPTTRTTSFFLISDNVFLKYLFSNHNSNFTHSFVYFVCHSSKSVHNSNNFCFLKPLRCLLLKHLSSNHCSNYSHPFFDFVCHRSEGVHNINNRCFVKPLKCISFLQHLSLNHSPNILQPFLDFSVINRVRNKNKSCLLKTPKEKKQ